MIYRRLRLKLECTQLNLLSIIQIPVTLIILLIFGWLLYVFLWLSINQRAFRFRSSIHLKLTFFCTFIIESNLASVPNLHSRRPPWICARFSLLIAMLEDAVHCNPVILGFFLHEEPTTFFMKRRLFIKHRILWFTLIFYCHSL